MLMNPSTSGDRAPGLQEASTSTAAAETATAGPGAGAMNGQLSSLHAGDRAELLPKPKPYDLEQRIKKIISLNTAIVEHNDPFWAKKLMNQRHHSTSSLPSPRGLIHHQSSTSTSSYSFSSLTSPLTPSLTPSANTLNYHPISHHPANTVHLSSNSNETGDKCRIGDTLPSTVTTTTSSSCSGSNSLQNQQMLVAAGAVGTINTSSSSASNSSSNSSAISRSNFNHLFEPNAVRRRYSEVSFIDRSSAASRLHSALMGKPVVATTQAASSVITDRKLSQGLSVVTDAHHQHESVIKNGKAIMQAANGESDPKASLVRNLLTSKVSLAMKTPLKANPSSESNASEHERSVIKDLLLKPRDAASSGSDGVWRASPKSPTGVSGNSGSAHSIVSNSVLGGHPSTSLCSTSPEQELSALYYVCTLCKVAFRTKDTLEAHALHYCKSSHQHQFTTATSHHDHTSDVQRKVSVMHNLPSVLQRRLTEGRSSLRESTRNSLGNILKKTLEDPKRKISEPVFPSRFASEPACKNSRKLSIFNNNNNSNYYTHSPLSKTSSGITTTCAAATLATTVSAAAATATAPASVMPDNNVDDSFTKQVSAMLERKMSRNQPNTLIAPMIHDLTIDSSSSSSSLVNSVPLVTTSCTKSTIVLVPFSGKSELGSLTSCVDDKVACSMSHLDILPDYLPILKPSYKKITVTGPLMFPVLEKKIISEDRDLVEFQVSYPCEIGVNGLMDINSINSLTGEKKECRASSEVPVMQVTSLPCGDDIAMDHIASVAMSAQEANGNGKEEEKDEKENVNENSSHNRDANSFDNSHTCNSLNMENNVNNNNNNSMNSSESGSSFSGLEKKVALQVVKDCTADQREIGANQLECKEFTRTRPSSLALRPSTFGQLIRSNILSPETPRLHKKFTQLFHNGHAYTYIGLKVSTRSTYCCIYRPQPMFVAQETEPRLSMYSNWQPSEVHDSLLREITPRNLLSAYDMKQSTNSSGYVSSPFSNKMAVTCSAYWLTRTKVPAEEEESRKRKFPVTGLFASAAGEDSSRKISNCEDASDPTLENGSRKISEDRTSTTSFDSCDSFEHQPKRVKIFEGGFKSNESYTYIRGRGRGKYICEECGIRCKKPSMLKKHIRTHTDLRPYSCRHCAFAFKTKGNLTKHMKSKAHHKKCIELGIVPVPTAIDDSQIDTEALAKQEALERSYNGGNLMSDDDDNDNEDDEDGDDNDSDDEGVPIPLVNGTLSPCDKYLRKISCESSSDVISRRPSVVVNVNEEQEVAQSLLFLSGSWSDATAAASTCSANRTSQKKVEDSPSPARRKVSILESTLATSSLGAANLWNNSYFTRPRSFSFNDAPLRSSKLTNYNNTAPSQQVQQQVVVLPQRQQVIQSAPNTFVAAPPANGPSVTGELRLLNASNDCYKIEEDKIVSSRPGAFSVLTTQNSERPENDAKLSGESNAVVHTAIAETDAQDKSPCDGHEDISDNSVTMFDTSVNTKCTDESNQMVDDSEDEPMDLSKRQQQEQALCEETDDMDDEGMPMIIDNSSSSPQTSSKVRNESPYLPVALSSGAEDCDGKSTCSICNKTFSKPSQLRLHLNIHYFERPHRCDSCAVSFRTKGHLQKHKRSSSHFNKVNMNKTFGTPSNDNPRPFKCIDCKVAFRIHGHLAKHLRSKLHIMHLECLNKLPFGLYAEMERSGINLNQIDTSDCDLSLLSLQEISRKLSNQSGSNLDMSSINFIEAESITDDDDEDEDASAGVTDELVHDKESNHVKAEHLNNKNSINDESTTTVPTNVTATNVFVPSSSSSHSLSSCSTSSSSACIASTPISSSPSLHCPAAGVSSSAVVAATATAPSQASIATRSNTCHLCGQVFKSAKFLQVHLYTGECDKTTS